jgi:hypothetical protein
MGEESSSIYKKEDTAGHMNKSPFLVISVGKQAL